MEESATAPVRERTRALSRVSTAGARTLGLSLLLVALSAGALVGLGVGSWHPPAGRQLRWHDLMLIAALAEVLALHLTSLRECDVCILTADTTPLRISTLRSFTSSSCCIPSPCYP